MTDLCNKVVLITGAGGGFGRHMTQQLRDAGCQLVLTDMDERSLRAPLEAAADALLASVAADLGTEEGCRVIADTCSANRIIPDVLVNNAGIGVAGRLDHVPREWWETLMQLNLLAPMRLCNLFLPGMIDRDSGHIVNISSLAGWIGSPRLSSYCASKFGLRGFGDALSEDLKDTGVRVTSVYPCFSRTPILDSPQYGLEERQAVPEHLISEPADVVAKIITGIQKNRLDVFPDRHARRIHYLKRFVPWVIPLLNHRRHVASLVAGRKAS